MGLHRPLCGHSFVFRIVRHEASAAYPLHVLRADRQFRGGGIAECLVSVHLVRNWTLFDIKIGQISDL